VLQALGLDLITNQCRFCTQKQCCQFGPRLTWSHLAKKPVHSRDNYFCQTKIWKKINFKQWSELIVDFDSYFGIAWFCRELISLFSKLVINVNNSISTANGKLLVIWWPSHCQYLSFSILFFFDKSLKKWM